MVPCSIEKMNLTENATANYFSENAILSLKKKMCYCTVFALFYFVF